VPTPGKSQNRLLLIVASGSPLKAAAAVVELGGRDGARRRHSAAALKLLNFLDHGLIEVFQFCCAETRAVVR
jgi:hypothetical protein